MLSIVKMDFDSDVEILEENLIKSETTDIEDTTIFDDKDILNKSLHDLELVPIVYTTKLEDMGVLKLEPTLLHPDQASVRILNESKPVLRTYPGPPKRGRKNTKRFGRLKAFLEKIYCSTRNTINTGQTDESVAKNKEVDEITIKNEPIDDPDICAIRVDLNSVKSEVLNEPIVEETKSNETCKYSELLKLCKPCSVVLVGPVLIGPDGASQVIHGGQVLKASRVQKPSLTKSSHSRSSEDDDAPLITLYPPDLVERKKTTVTKPAPVLVVVESESIAAPRQYKGPKLTPNLDKFKALPKSNEVKPANELVTKIFTQIAQRLMRNSFLEIHDVFSDECHIYYADNECNLLVYFKERYDTGRDRADLYHSSRLQVDCRYKIDNCCWVKKDERIQSLYPKVLVYNNSKFMRKPHPCKPGACNCCCRKKENVRVPGLVFTDKQHLPSGSNIQKSIEKVDVEILDVEDKIDKTIISINKSQNSNLSEKLQNSLIGKALAYKGPLPQKQGDNRRLVTFKRIDFQNTVIVLRNYAEDIIEIYEKDADGDIVSYIKTTCYGNSDQSNIIKLLNKPNSACEAVCCWFKREYVITKLQNSITIQPRAAKFIRTNHTCQSTDCTCCCKPIKEDIELHSIDLPCRSQRWKSALNAWGLVSQSELQKCQPSQPVLAIPFETASQTAPSLEKDNDEDCQITSVTTSPIFQPLPKPTVPPSVFVPEAVNGDVLSKEVNSLITSILDRFKDVRLTINKDGKVAAALNTPVNTLSTVELKVLANILSYAQSQIDLLGSKVNSGMSLSNIINLKVDDVQSNRAQLDPNTIYKEFGKNVTLNTNIQTQPSQSSNVNNTPMALTQAPAAPQTYTFFTNSTSVKNQHFNDAFSSYINSNSTTNPETITPVIENVYSLKDSETAQKSEGADEHSSFTTVWYRKPAQSSTTTIAEEAVKPSTSIKRNDDSATEATQSKKKRLLSPTKLCAAADKSDSTAIPIPNLPTAPVNGNMPRIIILPNNNCNVQSLGQPHIQGTNNNMPPATTSHPILIINPLQDSRNLSIENNTPNMAGISHFHPKSITSASHLQSKIPRIIDPTSTSHLNDSGTKPVIVAAPVPTSVDADVTETPDQDLFPGNDQYIDDDSDMDSAPEMDSVPEMETVPEMESVPEFENDPNTDNFDDNLIEMKYSPESNEDEEDCILGF